MKRQWEYLKCERCVNFCKCGEEQRLRKMRWLVPGCMVEATKDKTRSGNADGGEVASRAS